MLYKKNSVDKLNLDLFRNPTSEYRGTPFWAWNTDLKIDELKRQIDIFKQMGLGGFHMHVRTGLSTPYLSDEFMELIKGCVDKAEEENMLAWLYDEDRWPSGAAGGLVTKDEKNRGRCLFMTTEPCTISSEYKKKRDSMSVGDRDGNGYLLTCFDIVLNEDGTLKSYNQINEYDIATGTKWYCYVKILSDSAWYNNQAYVDTLNNKAIEKFIEITHERYKEIIGDRFDKSVPAIFTDEPQFTRKANLKSSFDKKDCNLPWTDNLPETFKSKYGYDLIAHIPELFWELPDNTISKARYHYHDHVCDRFTEAFADTIGKWCDENGIKLTGHMMEEPTLKSQTCALGEAMRSYRSFGIPGIDMLCANFEFTTAKQTQSAVHQYGKEGMLSELYGVTGWDYDFRGYKLHGDWQACLGVTVRVPHLSWVAMGGEAKRDYPASISYQSPWWSQFSYIEDHFARVNTLMTRGKPIVKVGVIHPIESYWLHFGPDDKTKGIREEKDKKFQNLTEWLLNGSVDFDFISESLLPDLCKDGSNPLRVGEMSYDVIVVPGCESIRSTTLDRLTKFKENGGKLIFIGNAPTVIDGILSNDANDLYSDSLVMNFDRDSILNSLEDNRTIKITENDKLTDSFIYQLREDCDGRNLFISRCCEPDNKHTIKEHNIEISVCGEYYPVKYDTISGDIYKLNYEHKNGNTKIKTTLYEYDSLLLKLYNEESKCLNECYNESFIKALDEIPDKVEYNLNEDNVLLIDICEYSLDDSEFSSKDEILRLDNICREKLGWEDRGGHVAQPWCLPEEVITHKLTLRYTFDSEINYKGAKLAIEKPEKAKIIFNGKSICNNVIGWWTDKDIKLIELPEIIKGKNQLVVTIPFGETTNTEWMYILGEFGVRINEQNCIVTNLPDKIGFGSITDELMPFYGGNITYRIPFYYNEEFEIQIPHYMGTLISVSVDNDEKGKIVYPPYNLFIKDINKGNHSLDITLFGNRVNCFGPVHRTISNGWLGPDSWRTKGGEWSYNYCLKNIGIMEKPLIKTK